jgi:hypothetical protein
MLVVSGSSSHQDLVAGGEFFSSLRETLFDLDPLDGI